MHSAVVPKSNITLIVTINAKNVIGFKIFLNLRGGTVSNRDKW